MKGLLRRARTSLTRLTDDFPKVVSVECAGRSAVFEVTNPTERYRAEQLGGEREFLTEVLDCLDEGDCFWDVGGNIGVYAIFAARCGASVEYFEPDPGFRRRATRNIELNGQSDRIHLNTQALAEGSGTATLYTDGVNGNSPSLSGDHDDRRSIEVELARGDQLDRPQPTAIKIDVEGAEAGVLSGLGDRLANSDMVAVEIHPEMIGEFSATTEEVYDHLHEAGLSESWRAERDEQVQTIFERD